MCYKPIWAASWLMAEARLDRQISRSSQIFRWKEGILWKQLEISRVLNSKRDEQKWKYSIIWMSFLSFWGLFVAELYSQAPRLVRWQSVWVMCMGILWKVPMFPSLWRIVHTYSVWTNGSKVFTRKKTQSHRSYAQDNPSFFSSKMKSLYSIQTSSEEMQPWQWNTKVNGPYIHHLKYSRLIPNLKLADWPSMPSRWHSISFRFGAFQSGALNMYTFI